MKLNPSLNVSESSLKLHTKEISKKSKNVKKRNVTVKDTLLVTSGSPKSSKNKKKHAGKLNRDSLNTDSTDILANIGTLSPNNSPAKKKKNRKNSNVGKNCTKSIPQVSSDSAGNGHLTDLKHSSNGPSIPEKNRKRRKKRNKHASDQHGNSAQSLFKNKNGSTETKSLIRSKRNQTEKEHKKGTNNLGMRNTGVSETSDLEGIGKVQGQKMEESRQEHAGESSVPSQDLSIVSVLEDRKSISNIQKKREKFKNSKNSSLREKMLSRLSAARFRFINEELYTWDGQESPKVFASNPKSFKAYHSGFKQQTKLWPVNPIDLIIKSIKKLPDCGEKVIADFGCGEAKLALELSSNKVYSFDLVAINDRVTVCDNANTKLYSGSVDIAVHCLSLMSSNISGYIKEANRVLKIGGTLKIAEVESRFENVDKFIENVSKFNFKLIKKDLTRNLFYFLDFEKVADIGVARKRKLPVLSLQPCLYKKR